MEDINLDNNWIGDGGGRELLLALRERKDGIKFSSLFNSSNVTLSASLAIVFSTTHLYTKIHSILMKMSCFMTVYL